MEQDSKRSSTNPKGYMNTQRGIQNSTNMINNLSHLTNNTQSSDFYAAKVFLETMKEQNGDWFVGNKLWNVLTPDQRRLILFQRYQHMNPNNNNQSHTPQDQKQSNGYTPNKDSSQIP